MCLGVDSRDNVDVANIEENVRSCGIYKYPAPIKHDLNFRLFIQSHLTQFLSLSSF